MLKLTTLKSEEPVRVNVDNVAYYKAKGQHTEIVFVSPKYHEHTLVVKESVAQIDRLLGI